MLIDKKIHPYTSDQVSPIKCICCGKDVHMLYPEFENGIPEQDMWNDAIVEVITAGYGSSHDCDAYLIAVCDSCLEQKRKEGSAIFLYNGMFKSSSEEMRNEHNVNLHRKMKLKRILK